MSLPAGVPNKGGVGYNRRFSTDTYLYLRNDAMELWNLYVLYRMVLFPVTLSDPNYSIVSGVRDFKFGR